MEAKASNLQTRYCTMKHAQTGERQIFFQLSEMQQAPNSTRKAAAKNGASTQRKSQTISAPSRTNSTAARSDSAHKSSVFISLTEPTKTQKNTARHKNTRTVSAKKRQTSASASKNAATKTAKKRAASAASTLQLFPLDGFTQSFGQKTSTSASRQTRQLDLPRNSRVRHQNQNTASASARQRQRQRNAASGRNSAKTHMHRQRPLPQAGLLAAALLVCALIVFGAFRLFSGAPTPSAPLSISADSLEPATVMHVLDGDHLVVLLDGAQENVRLLGTSAPQRFKKDGAQNQKGEQSTQFLSELLPAGTTVYLQADANNRDADGNLLRYVWLSAPDENTDTTALKEQTVQGKLLAGRYAKADADAAALYGAYFKHLR